MTVTLIKLWPLKLGTNYFNFSSVKPTNPHTHARAHTCTNTQMDSDSLISSYLSSGAAPVAHWSIVHIVWAKARVCRGLGLEGETNIKKCMSFSQVKMLRIQSCV